ncbi:hypothetical protein B0H67DRAFT_524214 [Lasiosphaeris hirsuta]|uniref:DUF676 domain-containing protein n=1 Tax=Lasiosphaeris hirsuta TaxID=260670 RepID=A0AA39ZRY3_9PEZI|nr:hypothetical protein B0H67DRAFT_524214 [Lasiosphaeris hirsuta]
MARRVVLQELKIPEEGSPNIDIVLVHGLNGGPIDTWTHAEPRIFWPKEWLPVQFPQARVFSFGYNADMYGNTSIAGIRDNARSLLSRLELQRDGLASPTPIVFIAHCLGGLIVKQALCIAEFDSTYKDAAIHINTTLVAFFGTPNQGTNRDNWRHIAELYGHIKGERAGLVDVLLRNSDELSAMNETFRQLTDHYDVSTFYERQNFQGTDAPIVSPTDAQVGLSYEKLVPVEADHLTMCQFFDTNDFDILCSHIAAAAGIKHTKAKIDVPAAPDRPKNHGVLHLQATQLDAAEEVSALPDTESVQGGGARADGKERATKARVSFWRRVFGGRG